MKLQLHTTSSSKNITVSDDIFAQKINMQLLAQAIRVYQFNLRQGSSQVKTRSLVKRSKSKWYRQKGTGRARHGSRNAPIFVGGGVAHGPKGNENWNRKLAKKLKNKALVIAFSAQAKNIIITDALSNLSGKTKDGVQLISKILPQNNKKILVIIGEKNQLIIRSLQNLQNVLIKLASNVNALDVSLASHIIIEKSALELLEERVVKDPKANKKVASAEETKPKAKKQTVIPVKKKVKKVKKTEVKQKVKTTKAKVKKSIEKK